MTLADLGFKLGLIGKLLLASSGKNLKKLVNKNNDEFNSTFLKEETKITNYDIRLENYEREAEEYRQKCHERANVGDYSYKKI